MKIVASILLAKAIHCQFLGDNDDYESPEYNDEYGNEETPDNLMRSQGQKRAGGRRRMIKHLTIKDWRAFSDYGCWCIEKKGYGSVVDSVDFACMKHSKCWGCAKAENGKECEGSSTSYKWKFIKDRATKTVVDIKCLDKEDSCKKSICECDKQLAFNLRDVESVYNSDNKQTKQNADSMCTKSSGGGAGNSEKSLQAPSAPLDACCGDEVFKFPFAQMGGLRACCGTRTYDTETLECCSQEESVIKAIGTCA